MGRGHTPFGYCIQNGTVMIIPGEAEQIRQVYSEYISGRPYIEAAKNAGLTMTHSSVKRLLQNKHYLGDEFYPAIIDKKTFNAAETERLHRMKIMGRTNISKTVMEDYKVVTRFSKRPIMKKFKDPYEQAAYIYSLIESEE